MAILISLTIDEVADHQLKVLARYRGMNKSELVRSLIKEAYEKAEAVSVETAVEQLPESA